MALNLHRSFLLLFAIPFLSSSSPLPSCISPELGRPLWTLSQWTTDYTVPDGGEVTFRLLNALTGYVAFCSRVGLYAEGHCLGVGDDEDETGTLFTYYEGIGQLMVYQEWTCTADG